MLKKALLFCSTFLIGNFCVAEQTEIQKYSAIFLGPQVASVTMSIEGNSPSFHGALAGARLGYTYQKPHSLYAKAFISYALGRLKSEDNPSRFLHDESVEGQIGYVFACHKFRLTPYVGYGFHYLIQHRESHPLFAELTFKYRDYYLPLGLQGKYSFTSQVNFGVNFSWRYDIDPSVQISGFEGIHWTLHHKDGHLVSLPLEGFFDDKQRWSFCLEPYWQQYQIGSSKAVSSTGMPLGLTTQTLTYWGGLLTAQVHF